jgi:hypothetical protein
MLSHRFSPMTSFEFPNAISNSADAVRFSPLSCHGAWPALFLPDRLLAPTPDLNPPSVGMRLGNFVGAGGKAAF